MLVGEMRVPEKESPIFRVWVLLIIFVIIIGFAYQYYSSRPRMGDCIIDTHTTISGVSVEFGHCYALVVHALDGDDSAGNLTNGTIQLVVTANTSAGPQKLIGNYTRRNYNPQYTPYLYLDRTNANKIFLKANETSNVTYDFEVCWNINSSDPDVQNLTFLGDENRITGNFTIYPERWNPVSITVDDQYADIYGLSIDGEELTIPHKQVIWFNPIEMVIP